tara:strand:+ start:181 stop:1098 length:918 start_codon:yes stop_codon:yes gene_type:complete
MIFWRVLDNQLYNVGEVNKLGFEESEGLRIPDEYLDKLQFMVMRGAQGLGDWGIVSAMPRLLKQKYPTCKVYIPSPLFLSNLFNQPNESTWQNPYENVYNVFKGNPYIDGFKDFMLGEVFHDHYRIYDKNKKDIPLIKQMLKFWQFNDDEIKDYYPDLYFTKEEKEFGDEIIKEFLGDKEFAGLLITNRFESQGGRYDEKTNRKLMSVLLDKFSDLPFVYWTYKKPKEIDISFKKGFDLRNVPTRIQLYIRTKAKINIGTHCGFLDCVSRYSKVYQIQRVFPLNQNVLENEVYVNKENYKEVLND